MHFPELSTYLLHGRLPLSQPVTAVGWLSLDHPFSRGPMAPHLVAKVRTLAVIKSVNQMRGFHQCEFCTVREPEVEVGDQRQHLGSAEIWLPRAGGGYYASPNLILHYIEHHHYLPPSEWVGALESLRLEMWHPSRDIAIDLCPGYRT